MSRIDCTLAASVIALLTFGCGGGEDSTPKKQNQDSEHSETAAVSAWTVTAEWLQGVDLELDQSVTQVIELDPEGSTHVAYNYPIHPTESQVWVGRTDGSVIVVDTETLDTKVVEIAEVKGGSEECNIAIGGGFAYVGTWEATSSTGLSLAKIDTQTLEETDRQEVLAPQKRFNRILFDQGRLWVLYNSGLREVDAATLAVENDVPLSNSNSEGDMVAFGNSLWVVETTDAAPLWKFDKDSQSFTEVRRLSAEFPELDADGLRLAANADSIFVLFSDQGVVAQLDGVTGATRVVHRFDGADWEFPSYTSFGVTNQTLYVGARKDILAVDLATQAQRVAYTDTWDIRHFALAP